MERYISMRIFTIKNLTIQLDESSTVDLDESNVLKVVREELSSINGELSRLENTPQFLGIWDLKLEDILVEDLGPESDES